MASPPAVAAIVGAAACIVTSLVGGDLLPVLMGLLCVGASSVAFRTPGIAGKAVGAALVLLGILVVVLYIAPIQGRGGALVPETPERLHTPFAAASGLLVGGAMLALLWPAFDVTWHRGLAAASLAIGFLLVFLTDPKDFGEVTAVVLQPLVGGLMGLGAAVHMAVAPMTPQDEAPAPHPSKPGPPSPRAPASPARGPPGRRP